MLYKMLLFVIVVDLMWDFILDDIINKENVDYIIDYVS